jgi:hypothetical protein
MHAAQCMQSWATMHASSRAMPRSRRHQIRARLRRNCCTAPQPASNSLAVPQIEGAPEGHQHGRASRCEAVRAGDGGDMKRHRGIAQVLVFTAARVHDTA